MPAPTDRAAHFARVNGVKLHYVQAGPEDGPLVLLLHGFPEYWFGWREQLAPLARAGLRVVAPDLRGYNLSGKPDGLDQYSLRSLAADVSGLIEQLGHQRAHVVGHDWGGLVAWTLAMREPQRVRRLAILNAPHPAAYRREIRRNPRQMLKSWYVAVALIPGLSDLLLRHSLPLLARSMRLTAARPAAFPDQVLRQYLQAWQQPGSVRAMLNYYRAVARHGFGPLDTVRAPTLVLWGERDVGLVPELLDGLDAWVSDLRVVRYPHASHWLHVDEPVRVNQQLLKFLAD